MPNSTRQHVSRGKVTANRHSPRSSTSFLKEETGATLTEVAFTLPVFFLLVFGLVNFSLIMFGYCNISYASRAAVRYACLHSATSSPDNTVLQAATTLNTGSAVTNLVSHFIYGYPRNTYSSSLSYSGTGNQVGNMATVTVTITYNLSMPLFTYNGLTLQSTAMGVITQ